MHNFKAIRERLGMSQAAIGEALGMTQGNVSMYEHGQDVPSEVARKLIAVARRFGHALLFDDLYGKLRANTKKGAMSVKKASGA